jgi:glutamate/tyrosine decarboxylase-like PLP-dependent enzyme
MESPIFWGFRRIPPRFCERFVHGNRAARACRPPKRASAEAGLGRQPERLFGAPPIRVVLAEQAHSSVFKALALLGLGKERVRTGPADDEGRGCPSKKLPEIDGSTLLILQPAM